MVVTLEKKKKILWDVVEKMKQSKWIGFVKIKNLSVKELEQLRREVREKWGNFQIVKKTLMLKALKQMYFFEGDVKDFPGQIGVVYSYRDEIGALFWTQSYMQKIFDRKQKEQRVEWVAGCIEGTFYDSVKTRELSLIGSKEMIIAKLLGALNSPLFKIVRVCNSIVEKGNEKNVSAVKDI